MNDTNERQRRTITRSFIKEARRGRGWGRATVATVVAVAAVIAALGAFAFAQEIYGAGPINTQAPSEYTLNPQNDSNFPTPSIAYTTDTANAQFTSGTCLTSTTVAGASGFAELVISALTGGTVCTAGDFSMEFTFTTPVTLVSETATVSITTSWTDMGGVAHNSQTNTATVTVTAGAGGQQLLVYVDYQTPGAYPGIPFAVSTLSLVIT